ncbi:MAG: RNA methyltransferase [Hyphomonadaceae bacterium]|jgi:TrmH family RNA methyltransferase|nr:RNA methyltransferase [Hyphomonadaceae bacterium]
MTPRTEPRGAPRAITSLQNEKVKLIRALEMRKVRRETGLFVAEGASVLVMARDAGWAPKIFVFLTGSAAGGVHRDLLRWAQAAGAECLEVSEAVLGKLAAKDNPQTMLAVFEQRWLSAPASGHVGRQDLWVALEGVRDPGNLGTIIRTVDAVGGSGVALIGNSVDPYHRDAVRATMGSIFHVPLARMTEEEALSWLPRWPGDTIGTHLGATEDFRAGGYRLPALLVMGSEGPGLSAELSAACTRRVKIPMAGRLDSLNLAVATGLMLYEIARDRLRL